MKSGESEETYYKRIFMRHSDETTEQYRKRVDEIRKLKPDLKVWEDSKYLDYTSEYSSRVVMRYMVSVYYISR